MSILKLLAKTATGSAIGVSFITALPILGVVGTITATGVIVGSIIGAVAGASDYLIDDIGGKKI